MFMFQQTIAKKWFLMRKENEKLNKIVSKCHDIKWSHYNKKLIMIYCKMLTKFFIQQKIENHKNFAKNEPSQWKWKTLI